MHSFYNKAVSFSLLPVKARIVGRRVRLTWFDLPEWAQIVSVAFVILVWLYAAVVILFA